MAECDVYCCVFIAAEGADVLLNFLKKRVE